jgi:hypothetical protein
MRARLNIGYIVHRAREVRTAALRGEIRALKREIAPHALKGEIRPLKGENFDHQSELPAVKKLFHMLSSMRALDTALGDAQRSRGRACYLSRSAQPVRHQSPLHSPSHVERFAI